MTYLILHYIYFSSLLFAGICAIYRFEKVDRPTKVLAILVSCAFINECAAYYLAYEYHNNRPLYNIYSLIEFGLICLYFNKLIDVFIKTNIGIYFAVLGIAAGILNLTLLQSINSLNSYFLFFEGLAVIGMSLFAFFRLLLKHDSLRLRWYPHFWFISIMIFFWSITFLNCGLYDFINQRLRYTAWKLNYALFIVTTITYTCMGCVFLLYPKMQETNDRS